MAPRRSRMRWRVLSWFALAILALPTMAIALLQIPVLRSYALQRGLLLLKEHTGYDLKVARLERLDPWGVRARNLSLRHPDGSELARLSRLDLQIEPTSLLQGGVRVSRVVLRGGHASIPERLLRSSEAEPDQPGEKSTDSASFAVRVDDIVIEDISAELRYAGASYQVGLARLQGAGCWCDLPALTLGVLDARVADGRGRELVALRTRRGEWDARSGGVLVLVGALVGAPLALTAHFDPLPSDDGRWPEGSLELKISDLQRRTLEVLGLASGAGLVGRQDLELHVSSRDQRVELSVQAAQNRLRIEALLDEKHVEATVRSFRVGLSDLSDLLPDLDASGKVWASYEFREPHALLAASLRGVELDGQAIPDASLRAEQLGSVIALRELRVAGFEQALRLTGSMDAATGALEGELHLKGFALDRIPWLASQGARGLWNADLAIHLDGRDGFSGQGFLDIAEARYLGASAERVQLELGLHGSLSAPRGQAELVLHDFKAGRVVLHRLSADFDGSAQAVQARVLAHGPDTAFNAFITGARATSESYELEGSGHGRVAGQPLHLRLRAFAETDTGAYVGDLWLLSKQQRVRGHGEVDRQGRFQATLETQSLDLEVWSRMAGIEGVRGHVESFIHVVGTTERPLVNVKLNGGGLYVQNEGPFDLMLNLETDLRKGRLYSDLELTSSADETRVNTNVRASFPASDVADLARVLDRATYELTLRSQLPMERFAHFAGPKVAALRGSVDVHLDAHGNLDDPHAEISLLARLGLPADSDLPAEVLRLQATATPERAELALALRDAQGELLSAKVQFAWPGGALRDALGRLGDFPTDLPKFQLRGYLAERRLDMMQGAVAYLAGVYDLALPVKARAVLNLHGEGQRLDGTARAQVLVFGDKLDPDCALGSQSKLDVDAALAENRLDFKLLAYTQDGGSVRAKVTTHVGKDASNQDFVGPLEFTAQGQEVSLSKLPGLCDLSAGKADFFLRAHALGQSPPDANLQLNVEDLRTATSEALAFKVKMVLGGEGATAQGELLVEGKHAGSIDASVPLEFKAPNSPTFAVKLPIKGRLQLKELPLAPFFAVGEKLGRAGGRASADLLVEGSLERPRAKGYLEVKNASFAISSIAQPFRGVDARVEIADHRITLRRLSAKDLGGSLRIEGEADFKDDLSAKAKLLVQAEKFPIRRQGVVIGELTTKAEIEADLAKELQADLRVNVVTGRMWLTGDKGRAVQSLDPNETVHFIDAPEQEVAGALTDEPGGLVLRSLKLQSEREIWLMHKDFSVQLGFDIRLTEEEGPMIEGEARIKRGDLMLLGKSFALQKGAIRFTGDSPPDPELDLRAVYKPTAGEDLIVQVTGRASSPALTFSGAATDAGGAVMVLSGRAKAGAEAQAQADAAGFAASVTAGLLSVTARRELGDWVPMLRVETDANGNPSRAAAGFDASRLIPPFLGGIAKGAYVEGIVGATQANGASRGSSVGLGVRLELSFPRDLVTTLGYGPGPNWSTDIAWVP